MAHRFVVEAQRRVEPVVAIANQGVIEGTALDQAGSTKLLDLVAEAKGAGRRDLLDKGLGGELQAEDLLADRGLAEGNGGAQTGPITGQGRGETLALLQGDRPFQHLQGRPGSQVLEAGGSDRLNPGQGRAIQQGNFMALHQDRHLAQAHPGQGSEQVLHRGQTALVDLQGGAELGIGHLGRIQQAQGAIGPIEPADAEAR